MKFRALVLAAAGLGGLPGIADAQQTERASVGTGGVESNGDSFGAAISSDGRFVVFESYGSNLAAGDTNLRLDVFVRDRATGTTVLASVDSTGTQIDATNLRPSISGDGSVVAFESWTQPVPGNNVWQIFVRDLAAGTSTSIAAGLQGVPAPTLSVNGRYVTFTMGSTPWDGASQVWVHDRQTGATVQASVDTSGGPPSESCGHPSISADGRFVAFFSGANDLVAGDANEKADVFVRDLVLGTTELVSVSPSGMQGDGVSWRPSISADGRYVAFESGATNLVPGDANGQLDLFVRDRLLGTMIRITDGPAGPQNDGTAGRPRISGDGRFLAYQAPAANIVPGDTNGVSDVFVHDLASGTTARASVDTSGTEANAQSSVAGISGDGSEVVFASSASNLVPGDTNASYDVLVRDLAPSCVPAATYCTASANSSGQPAAIGSTGWASFSANNLVLTCSGLPLTTNGLFFHGTVPLDPGVPFGNGVRCVGGSLQRLGVVVAQGGMAEQAQDLGGTAYAGLAPGAARHFAFWFRDPAAGGANFNASNGLTLMFCL